jgi:hypothetical protein
VSFWVLQVVLQMISLLSRTRRPLVPMHHLEYEYHFIEYEYEKSKADWILNERESAQITQEFKTDNLARVVLGAGAIAKRPANREVVKEMRASRSSGWQTVSNTMTPREVNFLDFDGSTRTSLASVAAHWTEALHLQGSALSLEHLCSSRCTDLADAALDLHLLQKGLVVCVVAACLALLS